MTLKFVFTICIPQSAIYYYTISLSPHINVCDALCSMRHALCDLLFAGPTFLWMIPTHKCNAEGGKVLIFNYVPVSPQVRYGYDRARWRGLWRVQIQEYLISAVQNIEVLLRYGSYLKRSPSVMMEQIKGAVTREIRSFSDFKELMSFKIGQMVLFGSIYPRLSFIET